MTIVPESDAGCARTAGISRLGRRTGIRWANPLARVTWMFAPFLLLAPSPAHLQVRTEGQSCLLWQDNRLAICAPIERWSEFYYLPSIDAGTGGWPYCQNGGCTPAPPNPVGSSAATPGNAVPGDPAGFLTEAEALSGTFAKNPYFVECGSASREGEGPLSAGNLIPTAFSAFPLIGRGGTTIESKELRWLGRSRDNPPVNCSIPLTPRLFITKYRTAQCADGYFAGNIDPAYTKTGLPYGGGALQQNDFCWRQAPANQKNLGGCPSPYTMAANPIHTATGNKYEEERDFRDPRGRLSFIRSYNSQGFDDLGLGLGWRHTFQRSIGFQPASVTYPGALARRPDGKTYRFARQSDGSYLGDADVTDTLTQQTDASGNTIWLLRTKEDETETYDTTGRLLTIDHVGGTRLTLTYSGARVAQVRDDLGRTLTFSYDGTGQLLQVTEPGGGQYQYGYDSSRRLTSVGYPDATHKSYVYNEQAFTAGQNFPSALTGIVDENGIRFATFKYDTAGRAISSEHAGGAQLTTFTFNADGTTTLVDAKGTPRKLTFTNVFGRFRESSATQPCTACGGTLPQTMTYDANGNVASVRDFNGNGTNYAYGARNLEAWRVEGYPSKQRMIATTWHPSFRLPATISEPVQGGNRVTTFNYDGAGNLVQKSIVAPANDGTGGTVTRTFSWAYTTLGRVLTATDPNGRITTYTYYPDNDPGVGKRGNLQSITNPLGHVTQFTAYDGNGRLLTIVDPNGLSTQLTYDARGRLINRNVGGEQTTYSFDNVGQLTLVTAPDFSTLAYTYDAAHRLTQIQDGLGNKIVYTLDAMGNRTREQWFDPGNVLARTRTRVYDSLSRLAQDIGALGQTTSYGYDNGTNVTSSIDPLSHATGNTFDALNRLTQVLDPANGVTKYAYDEASNLSQVTDPRGLATAYKFDGLGNLIKLTSPDTGVATSTFDPAGNLLTKVDARGATASYAYDAINRVSSVVYSKSGTSNETQTYTYDIGTNAKGRVTQLVDPAATTAWTYTVQGRVASKTQSIGGIAHTSTYGYNAAGQLANVTTPSGQVISYSYANNRVASVKINGGVLVSGVAAFPFGPVEGWQWGNAEYTFRRFDSDGRLASWEFRNGVSVLRSDLSFDLASRIIGLADPNLPANSGAYQYDVLDRLTVAQQGSPVTHTQQFNYDAVGNRQNVTIDGLLANLTHSTGSNRLQGMSGWVSPTYLGGALVLTYTYNNANRMTQIQMGSQPLATYSVNGLGQRVQKVVGTATTRFVYDEQGRLLGEYDGTGKLIQETVWLDNLPIATLRPTGAGGTPTPINVYYVHADHLGSPRAVTRPSDNAILWRWDNTDPFGTNAANENPAGQGTFRYALRFPGQYYDAETGMHYNYFRDYDPTISRYEQSDPIGLAGGLNTYAYVASDPLELIDPLGQNVHGNWCGPGGAGPAIDGIDECCKDHDGCYDKCKADWKNHMFGTGGSGTQSAMTTCDKSLCSCLKNAKVDPGSAADRAKLRVAVVFGCLSAQPISSKRRPPSAWE